MTKILGFQLSSVLLLSIISAVTQSSTHGSRRRGVPSRVHIKELKGSNVVKYSDYKKKASECRFGDQRFELEETWHPDLGSPFGVMYCVHCQCVPIHKKRRILGRVRCKNIKSECPKPTCSNPVLLQERCCKICPGQTNNPDLNIQVDLKREEEEKNGRHYAALLTSPSGSNSSATGRFYFRRKALIYSFVVSPDFGWPRILTFLDEDGNIIEEFPLQVTPFQNYTRKVCGSWDRLPRRYRRQLRRDQIFVQLTGSSPKRTLSGRIGKYFGLGSELFSSLLLSDKGGSEVGTAIISLSTQLTGVSRVHVMLLLSGLLTKNHLQGGNAKLSVLFEDSGNAPSLTETLDIDPASGSKDLLTVDFKTTFDSSQLEALGRGSMRLSVLSNSQPSLSVSNIIVPRFSCDYFDTSLTPIAPRREEGSETSEERSLSSLSSSSGRGVVWMYITQDGKIIYRIRINHLSGRQVVSIQIDNGRKSRRLLRIVADLLPSYDSGWVNGTLSLPAEDIMSLYHEDLYVNIGTANDTNYELRGRLFRHLKTDAQEDGVPILLMGNNTIITGVGWIHVDSTCTFNYEVRLNGQDISKKNKFQLNLVDFPLQNLKALSLFPEKRLRLEAFHGPEAMGHTSGLHKLTMARLNSGDAALVVSRDNSSLEITGKITHARVPYECLPRYRRNELELIPGYLNDIGQENRLDTGSTHCIYQEFSIYEDGDQWTAAHEACSMCSCRRGQVVCDPIVCPETDCDNPMILEGECCATCPTDVTSDNSLGCVFSGDKKFHIAGTRWHPYIPPFGFSRCAVCTCDAGTLQVKCKSKDCPKLSCPPERQFRPDVMSCCKACKVPDKSPQRSEYIVNDPEILKDMGSERTREDVLREGGCLWRKDIFNNGDAWHPNVLPFGEMKCVDCTCKDGVTKCTKRICAPLTCLYQLYEKDKCCPRCALTKAEVRKIKKVKRLEKIQKIRRRKQLQNSIYKM